MNRHTIKPGHEHVCLVYFGKAYSDAVAPEKETDVWDWFTLDDLHTKKELNLKGNILFYAEQALKELGEG